MGKFCCYFSSGILSAENSEYLYTLRIQKCTEIGFDLFENTNL